MEELIQKPELEDAKQILEEYLTRNYTVQLNGLCTVNYTGRAKSKLDRGERLFLNKQDSALLIHGPDNYQPRNWQPQVDKWEVELRENELIVEAKRNNPEEILEVKFEEIDFVSVYQMVDKSDLQIQGDEVDIHDAIEEDPDMVEEGLKVIEREYKNPAGYIDFLAKGEDGDYVVVEVKRNPDHNTVMQLQRYIDEINNEYSGNVRGIIAAPKISDSLLDYLEEKGVGFSEIQMKDVIASYEEIDGSQKGLSDF